MLLEDATAGGGGGGGRGIEEKSGSRLQFWLDAWGGGCGVLSREGGKHAVAVTRPPRPLRLHQGEQELARSLRRGLAHDALVVAFAAVLLLVHG